MKKLLTEWRKFLKRGLCITLPSPRVCRGNLITGFRSLDREILIPKQVRGLTNIRHQTTLNLSKKGKHLSCKDTRARLLLVADLPTLIYGANVEESFAFCTGRTRRTRLEPFLFGINGEIQIFDLLNDSEVIQAAINTLAPSALQNILPKTFLRKILT